MERAEMPRKRSIDRVSLFLPEPRETRTESWKQTHNRADGPTNGKSP
jgi:hypothetical protein